MKVINNIARKYLIVIFLLTFSAVYSTETLLTPLREFDHITSIQGLSNNSVYAITQDSDGYIWIGTREGLNKFDGYSIRTYYHNQKDNNSLSGNFVKQLVTTSWGVLISGTSTGACYYNKEKDVFIPILCKGKSLGNVVRIIECSEQQILISTFDGLFLANSKFETKLISPDFFGVICEYKKGIIWAAYGDDILLMNTGGKVIKRYENSSLKKKCFDLSAGNIQCFFKDSRGIFWLGTMRNGLGYYKPETDEFISLRLKEGVNPIEDNFVRVINEDKDGLLWIGTESGLYVYNVDTQTFNFHGQSFVPADKGLNDKAIYSMFRSKDNVMWLGTYFGGVNYTSSFHKGFYKIYADGGYHRLSGNALSEMIETSWGDIWISTEDGGISIYNPNTRKFRYIKHRVGIPNTLPSNNVHALEEDENGNIWIGTFIGGLCKFKKDNGVIEKVTLAYPDSNLVQCVFSILLDSKKRMWVGAISGLYVQNIKSNFEIFKPAIFQDNFIYHVGEDSDGNIWVCSYENGIYKLGPGLNLTRYNTSNTDELYSDVITYFLNDSNKTIWFGTLEGGLVKYNAVLNSFKSYRVQDGLSNNNVYAIVKDKSGNLWLSTSKGLSMFNPRTEKFVNYDANNGLIGNQFNFKSCLFDSKGIMYFGAVNGLTFFNPDELEVNNNKPVIHLTDFKLYNSSLAIGEKNILSTQIDFQKEIKLKYKYKVFSIEFVALDYLSSRNIKYAYYLEGLEESWNYVGKRNNVTYTNLSPGKYTFHLKAANGDGVWSDKERTLVIRILPPIWLSVWGYLLYLIIFSTGILVYRRFTLMRQKEKLNVQVALMERQKNAELSEHRLNFFIYISHEFKTPLTLILTTLEHFMDFEGILPQFRSYGNQIRKNAMRLLFLINQLMEFRKIETDHASLKLNKGEIIGFIRSTFDSFIPLMTKKSISSAFSSNIESYIIYFDADKLEKILTNLLSNSCNSFEKQGSISLEVQIVEKNHRSNPAPDDTLSEIILTIKDDGPGLTPEKLKQIFEPFYSEQPHMYSSGIGLALVNSLVKFLNGQIYVDSAPGKGTTTKIQLPLVHNPSQEFIQNEVFIENNTSRTLQNMILSLNNESVFNVESMENDSLKEYEILIVEDNRELATFLSNHFSRVYKTKVAYDGSEGFQKALKHHPDLIISDIMMPVMDGFALCNKIKESFETCHIPVVLLTAKSGFESKIEGLHQGADVYIDKPFNLRELDLHVKNIIKGRENLRKHFLQFGSLKESVGKLANKDQKFIEELTAVIFEHLDDEELNVEALCKKVNISRTLIHLKLKKITGLSTTEFIKNIRLSEAKKLLQTGNLTVSEVAYKVGFSDPDYFRKSFKKMFEVLPSSLVKDKGSEESDRL